MAKFFIIFFILIVVFTQCCVAPFGMGSSKKGDTKSSDGNKEKEKKLAEAKKWAEKEKAKNKKDLKSFIEKKKHDNSISILPQLTEEAAKSGTSSKRMFSIGKASKFCFFIPII
ncbi:hypothetical protein Mgra_00009749 [Meloidogyne graminicola]|uniref:Uncharacterized protein n=1 Tax=Meloidogyne graminicola TaxID=189291 RepID=A0A8S9ZB82_9BILA|nr:hypothetical protein Mgra_00009749 [Meloidogyne graminicola]